MTELPRLFPYLSESEQPTAEERLLRYFAIVAQIADRVRRETDAYAQFRALTGQNEERKIRGERSNITGRTLKTHP
jgi:hypothetical protein